MKTRLMTLGLATAALIASTAAAEASLTCRDQYLMCDAWADFLVDQAENGPSCRWADYCAENMLGSMEGRTLPLDGVDDDTAPPSTEDSCFNAEQVCTMELDAAYSAVDQCQQDYTLCVLQASGFLR